MKHIFLLIILFCLLNTYAQQELSSEILQKMETMEVRFIDPVDSDYKIELPRKKKRKKELVDYDFKVRTDDRVVWIRLMEEDERSLIQYPHLEFHRLLTHLATNEGESNIMVYDVPRDKGVDWMSEARFTPKKGLSEYQYGTAKVYYKEGRGMIVVLYFDKKLQARFEPYVGFVVEDRI